VSGRSNQQLAIAGEVRSALDPPSGWRFHARCPRAVPHRARQALVRKKVAPQQAVACPLY
jgi:ABC-type dipeptide/oligopeptide/nickel transport system ATPase component